jgi:hypothetical protein
MEWPSRQQCTGLDGHFRARPQERQARNFKKGTVTSAVELPAATLRRFIDEFEALPGFEPGVDLQT